MMIILVITWVCLTSKQMYAMSLVWPDEFDHFEKNKEFSGQTCAVDESSFMKHGVRSKLRCAYQCILTEDCQSIFYTKDTGICHGCKLAYKHNDSLTYIMTGSEYFERIKPGYTYIGCFGDCHHTGHRCFEEDGRVMQHQLRTTYMALEMCYDHCLAFGLPYFGMQYSITCFCGDEDFDRDREVSRCTMPCAGNSSQVCGGLNALSVYKYSYGN